MRLAPLRRQVALLFIGFVATLILLVGVQGLLGSIERRPATEVPSAPTTAVPSAVGEGQPTGTPTTSSGGPVASASPGVQGSTIPSAAPSGDAVLIGAGDIADCGRDRGRATAALIEANPGTVFTAGDNAYDAGSAGQFRDCYDPGWGRFRDRTRPAPGNHDWGTKDLAGYLGYFGAAAGPNGTSWYSYDLGTWHVVMLDSNCSSVGGCDPASEQGRWLADDLRANGTRCTVAIWHHPRFSSGTHGNDPSVAPFWRALYDAGADLVINGHDHDYERFAPQDPDGNLDRERGVRQFVVGTGGAELRDFPTTQPNSQVRAAISTGVIRLVLMPTGYEWSFISTSGAFSDSGKGTCH